MVIIAVSVIVVEVVVMLSGCSGGGSGGDGSGGVWEEKKIGRGREVEEVGGSCLFTITDKSHLVTRLRSNSVMPPIRQQSIHQSNTLKICVSLYVHA